MPRFPAVIAIAATLGTLCLLLLMTPVALSQAVLVETSGLRGGRYVGSAAALPHAPRLVGGLGYAYTEGVLDGSDRHQRAFGELAAGYAPRRYLQVSLGFRARYDAHHSDVSGSDRGGSFSTDVMTRHAFALTEALSLGAQLKLHFPGAQSVGRGLSAVSPELAGLGTYVFARRYELSALIGYRFDRSLESVRDPARLSAADRLAASLSRFDAALLGALFAVPLGPLTTSLEWSWDVATGSGAPRAGTSPMRFRLAAQWPIAKRYVPGVELGVSPSARPAPELLARIEPRVWAALSFALLFEPPTPPPVRTAPAQVVLPEPEPVSAALRVLDAEGAPIAGARITLRDEGDVRESKLTDAEGVAIVVLPAAGVLRLEVEADGFVAHAGELRPDAAVDDLLVRLSRALPEGEIKGKVRSLRGGKSLRARVVVEPLGTTVDTDGEGNFELTVPPGKYRLRISADGHEPQERPAQVELHGVTILVVDLRRAPK